MTRVPLWPYYLTSPTARIDPLPNVTRRYNYNGASGIEFGENELAHARKSMWTMEYEEAELRVMAHIMAGQREAELIDAVCVHLCSEWGRIPGDGGITQVIDHRDRLIEVTRDSLVKRRYPVRP